MARIGILGGTFNPPHLAHLICAQEARLALGLDHVVLMPVAAPPHKRIEDDPGAERRLELCRLAVAGDPALRVSRLELDRPGPSYTVDTLRALRDSEPQDELTFIVGGDMAHALPDWREPEAVLELATLAVAERTGARRGDIEQRLAGLHPGDRVVFFEMPRIDISSSALRRRTAAGLPLRHLVPDAVADAIAHGGLYADAGREPAASGSAA